MPAELAFDLVAPLGMDGTVRFRDFTDCVYIARPEILKLYAPTSERLIGGRPTDRRLGGYIGFVLRSEIDHLDSRRRNANPPSLTVCPIMNFPQLIRCSVLMDGQASPEFAPQLHRYLRALPSSAAEIEQALGANSLEESLLGRLPVLVRFLRALLD